MTSTRYWPNSASGASLQCGLQKTLRSISSFANFFHFWFWLRWRFQSNRFVTLKVHTAEKENDPSKFPGAKLEKVIANADPSHEGLRYLRTAIDSFTIPGECGQHLCLTYVPMRETLATFQRRLVDGRIPLALLKPLLKFILLGLEYLHTKCHIVHTGTFQISLESSH